MDTARLSKIRRQLLGEQDGQDVTRLRVGIVTAVNTDGTCDVTISGTTVPGVPRLVEASVSIGSIVQMISYRGSLLIIGRAASGVQSNGLGIWARGQTQGSSSLTAGLVSVLVTNTVTFVKNRVYEIKTHGGVTNSNANSYADLRAYRAGPATLIGEFFRYPTPVANIVVNATGGGIYFSPAADVSGAVALYAAASTASGGAHQGASGTFRNIEVYDVGDISGYTGVTAW